MAKAAGPILQAVGTFVGGWIGAVIMIVGAMVSSHQARSDAARRARNAYNESLQDRTINIRSAVAPRRYVLGRARVGGTLAYADTVGDRQEKLDQVWIACDGPIAGVSGMWLGETFVPASDFASLAPVSGQYAPTARRPIAATARYAMTGGVSMVLPHPPRSSADVTVSGLVAGVWSTLAVSSVVGTTVTLAAPFTGDATVDYTYLDGAAPYQVQWRLGDVDQAATTWAGVVTNRWTAAHRLNGIAHWRSLCNWNENTFFSGAPEEGLLVDGVVVHDHRFNLNPVQRLTGAVVGSPGTLPTDVNTAGFSSGLSREVVGVGNEDGIPYFDLRIYGTTTASGTAQVRLPAQSACPAASPGQAWRGRAHVRLLAGSFSQFSLANLALMSWSSGGTGTVEATTALTNELGGKALPVAAFAVSDASTAGTTARVGLALRFNFASAATIDVTLRIGRPQLWRDTADPVRWTSNPAILAGWWMTLARASGGMGIPFDWIDWDSVTAAANVCDEDITVKKLDGTGYEQVKRYACHTVLSTAAAPGDNLQVILGAMAGEHAFTGGLYRVWAGAHRVPTITLTDRDVVASEPITIQPTAGSSDAPANVMNGRITDAARGYVEAAVTPVVNDAYVLEDGGEEPNELELGATTDSRQAQYLLGLELERGRPRMAASLAITASKGRDIGLGAVLQLDLDGYEAFDSLTWEVRGRENRFNGTYGLTLLQTKATMWALDPDKFLPIEQPVRPDTSYLWDVDELASFSASVVSPTQLPDGSVVLRIRCAWAQHSQAYVRTSGRIELRWREVSSDAWAGPVVVAGDATMGDINVGGVSRMRYLVQGRAVNGLPAYSDWAQAIVDVDPADALDGIDLQLSARALVLPADTSGNVTSYAAASTAVSVWRNGVDETASWTLARSNSAGVGSTLSAGTLTIISMDANTDAGYVDVTATRSGYPTQTARLSLGKARAGADGSSAFTATATANMVWSGGTAAKVSGTTAWDGSVRSDQAYPGGAGCAWVADTANKGLMIALNSDPSTDAGFSTLDYALNLGGAGTLAIYEAGSSVGSFGAYAVGDVFAIIYNGETVTYYRNGSVLRSVAAPAGMLLYLDSSFNHVGGSVSNLTFYPQAARGSDARLLQLTATSQVFQVNKAGGASPSSITFNANAQNLDGSPSFSVVSGSATLTGTGTSRTLTYANLSSDTATIQVSQDGLTDTITVAKIREGGDALIALLSNEAVVLPATAAGAVTSYAGAVTSMSVFRGSTDDTSNWTFSRVNSTGVTSSLVGNVLTVTALANANDSGYVDITAARSGYPSQTKRLAISKAKAGNDGDDGTDGSDAPLLTLSATSQIFTFDGNNSASPASQTITLTAVLANLSGTASFSCTRYDSAGTSLGAVTLGGSGNARTLTVAQFGAAAYANVTASLSGRSDTVTLVRVRDGANAVVSDLTNDTHTLPADALGNVTSYDGASTRMVVYVGLVDDSANWSFSAVASAGVTATLGSGSNNNLLTVTAMTAAVNSGYVDITATRSGYTAQTKRFSISKSKSASGTDNFIQGFSVFSRDLETDGVQTSTASITINTDGSISYTVNDATRTDRSWWEPNVAGVGTGKYVKAIPSGPNAGEVTGSIGTYVQLTSARTWTLPFPPGSIDVKSAQLTFVFSNNSGGTDLIGTGTGALTAAQDA